MWFSRMMLPGGKVLTREDVDLLQRKYPEVMLKVGDPVLDSVAEFEDDSKEREVAQTVTTKISKCMSEVQERFSTRTSLASINFNAMRQSVSSVLDYLKNNPVGAALLTHNATSPESYLAEHAGNVFYLSMVLGSAVRDYVVRERMRQTAAQNLSTHIAMDLLPLGLGAMFIDVGMVPLEHIFRTGYELTAEDRAAIRLHPAKGADMLPDSLPAGVKMVVRTHHEQYDGSGYPDGTTGDRQHVFTRIARICDAYDAGTAERVYKKAKSPARVIWEMLAGPHKGCYDPILAKVFASLIQPFPIGARIKLADGRHAVVVRYNRKQPFCPQVIVAFDADNVRLPNEQLEGPLPLGDGNALRMASFNGEDLSFVYAEHLDAVETPARVEDASLFEMAYP